MARAKEAAEQCGLMRIPKINSAILMEDLINEGCEGALLVFCDERSNPMNPIDQLNRVKELNVSFLIGPEGGFSDKERYDILELQNVIRPVSYTHLRAHET